MWFQTTYIKDDFRHEIVWLQRTEFLYTTLLEVTCVFAT